MLNNKYRLHTILYHKILFLSVFDGAVLFEALPVIGVILVCRKWTHEVTYAGL
jgi:hypothetical protein